MRSVAHRKHSMKDKVKTREQMRSVHVGVSLIEFNTRTVFVCSQSMDVDAEAKRLASPRCALATVY